VAITLDCIDLAIMSQHTHRLCQWPGRESIGTIALVERCQSALVERIGQVQIETREIAWVQQPLINDGRVRKRNNVAIRDMSLVQPSLNQTPGIVQGTFIII